MQTATAPTPYSYAAFRFTADTRSLAETFVDQHWLMFHGWPRTTHYMPATDRQWLQRVWPLLPDSVQALKRAKVWALLTESVNAIRDRRAVTYRNQVSTWDGWEES